MRVLFDIGHPGHVHLFKNLAHLLRQNGTEVLFTTREKEVALDLLRAENFPYKNFGRHYKSLIGKLWGLLRFDLKMIWSAYAFRPDLFISHGSIYAAHAAFLLRKKHLSLEDTGNMEQVALYRPFTDVILSPDVLPKALGRKQIRYKGYHEIAYLHPDFFKPDPALYRWMGLAEGEPYAIIRFVSWNASHDVGQKGLSADDKIKLVQTLSTRMKVFITAEADIPAAIEVHRLKLSPDKFHHALYYASIVISEGTTTAAEAGVLGTPAIYINTIPGGNCLDQEKYGLVFNTSESAKVFTLIDTILQEDRATFRCRSQQLLADKINVTRYLHHFITQRYLNRPN